MYHHCHYTVGPTVCIWQYSPTGFFCHQHVPAQQQKAQQRIKTQTHCCKDMKPTGALEVEIAATGIYISRGGHGPHLNRSGVTCHAGSLYTILDGAKEREGKDRTPCHLCGSQAPGHHDPGMGHLSRSVSLPPCQPRRTSGRARRWGEERGCSTPTSLMWPLCLQHPSFNHMDAEEEGGPGHLFHTVHAGGVKLSPNACHPNHILASLGLWAINTFKNGEEEENSLPGRGEKGLFKY